jgi:hypothetical protein
MGEIYHHGIRYGGGSSDNPPSPAVPLSHIGMVIHSTTLDTEEKVKEIYGGTTWIQLTGYVLRGAASGVTPDQNLNDGGADSVTVSSVASHNHTQNAHTHTQNAHTHTQNAHTHTQNAHDHTLVDPSNSTYSPSGARVRHDLQGGATGNLVITHGTSAGKKINGATATNQNATATNQNATATNQNQTATNQANGANYTVNTLPKYKNVYIWERTA